MKKFLFACLFLAGLFVGVDRACATHAVQRVVVAHQVVVPVPVVVQPFQFHAVQQVVAPVCNVQAFDVGCHAAAVRSVAVQRVVNVQRVVQVQRVVNVQRVVIQRQVVRSNFLRIH